MHVPPNGNPFHEFPFNRTTTKKASRFCRWPFAWNWIELFAPKLANDLKPNNSLSLTHFEWGKWKEYESFVWQTQLQGVNFFSSEPKLIWQQCGDMRLQWRWKGKKSFNDCHSRTPAAKIIPSLNQSLQNTSSGKTSISFLSPLYHRSRYTKKQTEKIPK